MTRPRRFTDAAFLFSVPLTAGLVVAARSLDGAGLQMLVQPSAALIVFGGTAAAVLFSFPLSLLARTARALVAAFGRRPESDTVLLARMADYASRARARGALSLEPEMARHDDPFLVRALSLLVDGVPAADVRHTLKTFSQVREEADAECALVLEAAGGYAPTLGILGAVLGLIQAMEHLTSPASVGPGIAIAFVATVYGVGAANLVFLPLATRLRSLGRQAALSREVVIEGAVAIQQGIHPTLVDGHLRSLLTAWHGAPRYATPAEGATRARLVKS
ncbi:MAG: MotA/TolQ/ExbB proton channel family protein [Vicinamibacterales bacterium]